MSKIKSGFPLFLLLASIVVLSGCNGKTQEQNQFKNQNQEKTTEQKRDGSGNGQGKVGNPPTEMSEACSGKSEGDSCEVTMPARNGEGNGEERKMSGVCKKFGNNENLSCAPSNMPQGGIKGDPMPTEE